MSKRRANREGTIYQRQNGTWCAQISVNGRRLTAYRRTQRECREWLTETLAKRDQGRLAVSGEKITLGEYLTKWLEIVEPNLRFNTHRQYALLIAKHVIPELGMMRLPRLRPDHFQALYVAKAQSGLGARTIQLLHAILHRALRQAMEWDLLSRNPVDAVRAPRAPRHEIHPLTAAEAGAFLAAAEESRYRALYHLAITTGLRCSELLGLRWADIDQSAASLHVQRQLYREAGRGLVFREPKTASGRRVVILSRDDLIMLGVHRKRQLEERLFVGGKWQDSDLVFANTLGGPIDQRNMTRDFKQILKTAGLPAIRFHDLRHTAASLMLVQGVHPKVVQERLGHADITLTLNTYSHVLPTIQRAAAESISTLLNESRSRTATVTATALEPMPTMHEDSSVQP